MEGCIVIVTSRRRYKWLLASHCKLSHQIRGHVKERVWTGHLFLLVHVALADGVPFGFTVGTDDVLIAIALEVDHVVIFLELVQLDIDEYPDTVRDSWESLTLRC